MAIATIAVGFARPIYPSAVKVCTTDASCQLNGDRNAVCTVTGFCTCDAGYSTLTSQAAILSAPSTYNGCFANGRTVADELTTTISVVITMSFPSGDCTRVTELAPLVDTAVGKTVGTIGRTISSSYTCPLSNSATPTSPSSTEGIFISLIISGTVGDLFTATFINFDVELMRNLEQVSLSIIKPPPQWSWWMYQAEASKLLCRENIDVNSVVMAFFASPGQCRSATCSSLSRNNPVTGRCDRNIISNSDDGLSDSALAGIICGSAIGVAIIVFLIYWFACRKNDSDEGAEETEEGKEVEGQSNNSIDEGIHNPDSEPEKSS